MKKVIEYTNGAGKDIITGNETTKEWVAKMQKFSKLNPSLKRYSILDREKVMLLRDLRDTATERLNAGYRVNSEKVILKSKKALLKAKLELRLLEKKYS